MVRAKSKTPVWIVGAAMLLQSTGNLKATDFAWISNSSGSWDNPNDWDPTGFPESGDNGEHLTKLNHINVDGDEACLTFVGKGGNNNDRYLGVAGAKTWTVGTGGLSKSTSDRFAVRIVGGNSLVNTRILVGSSGDGDVDGIVFEGTSQDYVKIAVAGNLGNSSVSLDDHAMLDLDGNVSDTSISVGQNMDIDIDGNVNSPNLSPSWTIGDDSDANEDVTIAGNVTGVQMTIGSTPAGSSDGTEVSIGSVGACESPHAPSRKDGR